MMQEDEWHASSVTVRLVLESVDSGKNQNLY